MAHYPELLKTIEEIRELNALRALASWDQETHMPPRGAERRAEQISVISRVIHEQFTEDRIGDLIAASEEEVSDDFDRANLRVLRKDYDRQCKLPTELVADLARTTALAQQHWKEARKADEFVRFSPWLEKIVRLSKQKALCLDPDKPVYDTLLDAYESGMTAARLQPLFAELREGVVDLVGRIADSGVEIETGFLGGSREYPIEAQEGFLYSLLDGLGFDREAGRMDVAAHPFCSGLSIDDVRLTVRYRTHDPRPAIFGLIHECGHGLYEQGLPRDRQRQPAAESASLGVHESQSRLWENVVGRSRAFWRHHYPTLQQRLPALSDIDLETWYRAINEVCPSLIRVDADEVTYNLHIILRMELEMALLSDELTVADLPPAWNDKMMDYLQIRPPSDADGVLQDVHWSLGAIGYFPTYSLGNIYGAQLYDTMTAQIGDISPGLAAGDARPMLDWMREHVHGQGRLREPADLVRAATGQEPSAQPLLNYLNTKFGELYGL